MMIDRMELSQKNGWIDKQGRAYIYFTVDEVKDRFHCANDKAVKLMRELDSDRGIGLIESVRQGLGKPNIIYVKNFVGVHQNKSKTQQTNFLRKIGMRGFRRSRHCGNVV